MDPISAASFGALALRSPLKCFAPWSRMPPEEWAEEVYRLPDGRRFRWSFAPYTRAMFLSLFDRRTIETALELYSRGLKSTVVLLAIGYVIDQAPRRILSLWPTNSQAEKWSKDNLCGELLDTTPPLNFLGSQTGRRLASNTLLHKLFPGGLIDIFGANAPGDMRRAKGSFLYGEEIDAIDTTVTDEGDQLAIFNKRGDEYPDTIRVFASYPSVLGMSRIHAKIEQSDWNEWYSTCVQCGGEPFVMSRREHLRFDKDKPEGARMECPRCKALLTDAERYDMAHRQGFDNWKPRNRFAGKRGFHGNAMLWPHQVDTEKFPGGFLQLLAQQQIDADNSDNPRRSWKVLTNTVDALPFDPTLESEKPPDWKVIADAREDYGTTIPEGGLFLTCFTDCQLDRLEVEWRAWGRNEESWGIDHVVLEGHIRHPEVWKKLRRELVRQFDHATGAKVGLGFGLIDGGKYAEDVYAFFQELARDPLPGVSGKFRASKGFGQAGHPVIDRTMRTVAKQLKGHHIGTWEAKDRIYERLKMVKADENDERPFIHYNQQFSDAFIEQVPSETVTIAFEKGEEVRKYENKERKRNEGLDLIVGNLAAFRFRPRNFDTLEAEILQDAESRKTGQVAKTPEPRARGRSSYVSDWR